MTKNMSSLSIGPIETRRFGTAIEVNPLGSQKICSFNCVYCDLGPSQVRMNQVKKEIVFPNLQAIEDEVRENLRRCRIENIEIQSILISGNGEPTLYPDFDILIEKLLVAKSELTPQAKLIVLTNGAHLESGKMIRAMNQCDERVVKLDFGNELHLKNINDPLIRISVEKLGTSLRKLNDFIVQSVFFGGPDTNIKKEHIEDWIELVGMLRPKSVQVLSINRPPQNEAALALLEDELYIIESLFRRKLTIPLKVFGSTPG